MPIKVLSILPDLKDCLPAMTAFLNASAISKGFFAFAIAVLTKTPSHPNSIAIDEAITPEWVYGILNKVNIKIIRSQTKLPLIIDAGLGQASDASIAMELGCDGVLVNTAIAKAKKPFTMALAFKNAVIAGRQSYLSGRIDKNLMGKRSSPKKGII